MTPRLFTTCQLDGLGTEAVRKQRRRYRGRLEARADELRALVAALESAGGAP